MGMCMPQSWTWTMTLPSASLVAETLAFCGLHRQLMGKYRGCRLFGSAGTAFGEGACRHHPKHVQNPGSSGDWVAESCGNRCGVPRLAGTLTMTTTTDGGTQMPHQRTWTMNHLWNFRRGKTSNSALADWPTQHPCRHGVYCHPVWADTTLRRVPADTVEANARHTRVNALWSMGAMTISGHANRTEDLSAYGWRCRRP